MFEEMVRWFDPADRSRAIGSAPKLIAVGLSPLHQSGHHFNELLAYRAACDLLGLTSAVLLLRSTEPRLAAELCAQPVIDPLPAMRDVNPSNIADRLVALADARNDLAGLWAALAACDLGSADILLFPFSHPFVLQDVGEWLASRPPDRRPSVFFRFNGDEIIERSSARNNSAAAIQIRMACADLRRRPGQERVFLLADTPQLARMLTRFCCRRAFPLPIPKFLDPVQDFSVPANPVIYVHLNNASGRFVGELEKIIRLTAKVDPSVGFIIGSKALPAAVRATLESGLGSSVRILPRDQNAADYLATISTCSIVLLAYEPQPYKDCASGVFVEAASLGKIVVAPGGTWMERQMAAGCGAGTTFAEPTTDSLVAAVLQALAESNRLAALARTLAPKVRETHSARRYIERMMDLARQPPDMRPVYQIGEDIDFSSPLDSRCFMGKGWGETEDWGVWTVDRRAHLTLRLGSRPGRGLVLKALAQAFLAPKHPRISVGVAAAGEEIAAWTFDIASPEAVAPRWCHAMLPPRSLEDPEGELDITFTIDAPASPLAAGVSDDARSLGLGLRKLTLAA